MPKMDDMVLLREYAEGHSEKAFAELVGRHVNLVYSAAFRSVGNPEAARDITQAVFIVLARKARNLSPRTVLSGWLYLTARLTAARFLRTEIRRRKREREACMQSLLNESESETVWPQIAPLLDAAMERLGKKDRDAIVLRFFENKPTHEVGAALGASEAAAKMRVSRALEKMRKFFGRRGVRLSAAAIAGAVSANSVQSAPVGLANTISGAALAKGAAAGSSTLTVVKGALKIMAWTKAKTAATVGAGLLLAAGTIPVVLKQISTDRAESLFASLDARRGFSDGILNTVPPLIAIQPSKGKAWIDTNVQANGKMLGLGESMLAMLGAAYGVSEYRIVPNTPLPQGKFDFIASLPARNAEALQREMRQKFSLAGRRERREMGVFILEVQNRNVPGLRQSASPQDSHMSWSENSSQVNGMMVEKKVIHANGQTMASIAGILEAQLKSPVINQTGLAGNFDWQLKWTATGNDETMNREALRQAVLDQLGLKLTPEVQPLDVIVVQKVN